MKNLIAGIYQDDRNGAEVFAKNVRVILEVLDVRCSQNKEIEETEEIEESEETEIDSKPHQKSDQSFDQKLPTRMKRQANLDQPAAASWLNTESWPIANSGHSPSEISNNPLTNILSDDDFCQRRSLSLEDHFNNYCDNTGKYQKNLQPGAYCPEFNLKHQSGLCDLFENCVKNLQGRCQPKVNLRYALESIGERFTDSAGTVVRGIRNLSSRYGMENYKDGLHKLIKSRISPFRNYIPSQATESIGSAPQFPESFLIMNQPQLQANSDLLFEDRLNEQFSQKMQLMSHKLSGATEILDNFYEGAKNFIKNVTGF